MKKVLLITPSTFGYEKRITRAIDSLGHQVEWVDERLGNGLVMKILIRLGVVRLLPFIIDAHVKKIISAAQALEADSVFVVNPETLRGKQFAAIREALPDTDLFIYKWDSVHQKPIDDVTFEVADRVYSFDPVDCRNDTRLEHWPLFHDHAAEQSPHVSAEDAKYDFAFVGSAHRRRLALLPKLAKKFKEEGRSYYFHLVSPSTVHHIAFVVLRKVYGYEDTLSLTKLDYDKYLEVISQTRCMCDVEFAKQSGLTMRTIEVVFSGTPLWTTNESLKEYEFYSNDRMFLMKEGALEIPELPIQSSVTYQKLSEKYSIGNWASIILNGERGLVWTGKSWVDRYSLRTNVDSQRSLKRVS